MGSEGGTVMKRFLNTSLAGLIFTTGLCVTVPGFAQDRRNPDQRNMDQRNPDQRSMDQRNMDQRNMDQRNMDQRNPDQRYQDQQDERSQFQRYHDQRRNDDHEWNDHEQRAYRMWLRNRHRREVDFNRLGRRDQQNYWNWRHSHSDEQLNINIR
jgi:hypothetical protein